MPRPTSIDRLPAEIRELIGRLRRDGRTIDEIRGKLLELEVAIPRSTLGREVQRIDALGELLQEQRHMAETLASRFEDQPDDRTARFNVEVMQALLSRLMADQVRQVELDPKEVKFLTESLRNLAQAAKADVDREIRVRDQVARQAAKAAEKVGKARGLSAETVDELKAAVLGVRA